MVKFSKTAFYQGVGLVVVVLLVVATVVSVNAHGASIDYTASVGIALVANFDSGEPMSEAQVLIYAPNDLSTPWMTGTTDDQGRYFFSPDPQIAGTWDVQVRQAGHGDIVHIPIGEGTISSAGGGLTTPQIILMIVSVVWGFIGTALYFAGRKKTNAYS